jgi:hypothetical protein
LGYRHFADKPLYLAYGRLWHIPSAQSEYSHFEIDPNAAEGIEDIFPRGGHNYYNNRDMELLLRRMKRFEPLNREGGDVWSILKERYTECLEREQRRMQSIIPDKLLELAFRLVPFYSHFMSY